MILFIFLIIPLLLYLLRIIFVRLLIIVHCRLMLLSLLLLSIIIDSIHPPSLRICSNLLITLLIRLVEILLLW
jgi:hypothetical protein